MQIQQEIPSSHSILRYDHDRVCIKQQWYEQSLFVSATDLIDSIPIHQLSELDAVAFLKQLPHALDILIIGYSASAHQSTRQDDESALAAQKNFLTQQACLMQAKIGVECMEVGAACRTFNVLLSEGRQVGLLLIK